ncbi:hypothetical protein [Mucilaginibacter lacusdianchii]
MYLRITIDGQCRKLAVSRKCDPGKWDNATERATGSKAELKP